eukprot:CAMPEP_0198325860 /NCGR_PEP_ID=MMETSP1450-20131203/13505_1 /TAXON_ID=753684 ORGANISM="Madagascaria erythrocladiodes, Strain CCMP3234" /NCGR_SAMPLE_ID=MMETSP1450 /ASSEMBLY_ACC=CAM_ASM_001115 /LENGTH=1449 /DNA_ID=CAMNT_0044029785 /DNA_START=79 /DNA_END=4428 /DNA_ORIENTATION=+
MPGRNATSFNFVDWLRNRKIRNLSEAQVRSLKVEEEYGNVFDQEGLDPYNHDTFDARAHAEKEREVLQAAEILPPEIRLAWHNVTLEVPKKVAPDGETVGSSFLAPFKSLFAAMTGAIPLHRHREEPEGRGKASSGSYKVLDDVSGYADPGEMVLFLGPPKSGTSSLFSFLSYSSTLKYDGEVLYNGFNVAQAGINAPKNWIRLVGQEDLHFPVLTVRETLQFAADCRTSLNIPFCERLKRDRIVLLSRMLGIERQLETVVGDESVRGVSGGEKKRVTIAEMLVGGTARLIFMDNFSKGLDAQTTLDIVKSLGAVAKQYGLIFVVSMQQPSNEVFEQFDKVCILDDGKSIYFGDRDKAEGHFESLGYRRPPARSTPDFLATVSDPAMRSGPPGGQSVLRGLDDLEAAFRSSEHYAAMERKIMEHKEKKEWSKERYETEVPKAVRRILEKDAPNRKRYQFQKLLERSLTLERKDSKTLAATIIIPVFIGLILGFMFFRMGLDGAGARNRASLLFVAGVYIGLGSLATMGKKYEQKFSYSKHKKAGFYEAGPFIFATAASDIVLAFLKSLAFSLSIYFLAGLNLQGSGIRFGFFLLILWATATAMDGYVRCASVLFSSVEVATAVVGMTIILFINFAGFLIPRPEIPGYFIWVYWISPLRYSNDALIVNEFRGLEFSCDETQLVPPVGPDILPIASRVCPVSTGEAYMTQVLGYFGDTWWKYVDVAALFGLYFVFLIIGTLLLRSVKDKPKVYKVDAQIALHRAPTAAKEPEGLVLLDSDEGSLSARPSLEHSQTRRSSVDGDYAVNMTEMFTEADKVLPCLFSWKDVRYTVPIGKNETKLLLDKVCGFARPGRVCALMGSSGAGKTTLLDVLAQRKTLGDIEGSIKVNGYPQNEFFPRISGYCEQMDIHMSQHRVKEALEFSAQLRLPEEMSAGEKQKIVDRTLDALDLRVLSEKLIGSAAEGIGISSEARKRVTIGVELVANPSILFLDEPTSGLDSRAAIMVMRAIRRAAKLGCSIVCTIHQPSSELFDQFDDLLLLQRGGRTVFFGELGSGSQNLLAYFAKNGAPAMEPGRNPADYMLATIGAGTTGGETIKDWSEVWQNSPEYKKLQADLAEHEVATGEDVHFDRTLATGWKVQYREVLTRAQKIAWRSPEYNFTRLALSIIQGVLLGVIFLDPTRNQTGVVILNGALFLTLIPATNQMTNVIRPTMASRPVLYRETSAGTYSDFSYFIAAGVVELPYTIVSAFIFGVILYLLTGLSGFGFFILAGIMLNVLTIFMGQGLSWASATETIAASIAPVINIVGNLLSGFLIPRPSLRPVFAQLYWINPFQYYLTGIVQNEFEGSSFFCEPEEFVPFPLATGEPFNYAACTDIPELREEQVTSLPSAACRSENVTCCGYCPNTSGDEILQNFSIGNYDVWLNLAILFGFIAIVRIVSFFALHYLKHNDR